MLFVGILVAFVAGLVAILFSIPALSLAVSAMFILLMSALILWQTSQIVHGECDVEVVEPAGSDTFVVTRLGGKEVVSRMRSDTPAQAGEPFTFAFNLDKAVFFDPASGERVRAA